MSKQERPSPEDLVAQHWPYLSQDPESLSSALSTAAELIRFTNHVLLDANAKTAPHVQDVQDAAYRLYELTSRLPQISELLVRRLERLAADDPTLFAYEGEASDHTSAALEDFRRAAELAEQLSKAFDGPFQKLAKVGHRSPDEE